MDGVDVLLHLIRAEREHLMAVCETMYGFNAAGRAAYPKFVPTYISEMKELETKHPAAHQHLCGGGFVVRRSSDYAFKCVATDQALEQTINKQGKGRGSVIGLSLRKEALMRWMKTQHITAEFKDAYTSLCDSKHMKTRCHPELAKARHDTDQRAAQMIAETINHFQNPFNLVTVPAELINITTGQVANEEVRKSLNAFQESGMK